MFFYHPYEIDLSREFLLFMESIRVVKANPGPMRLELS